ncbi:TPA: hypothetical protein LVL15_004983 [Klebsiella michiganensis]|nr:hypothetical protein [Klebsiella michiganensis]
MTNITELAQNLKSAAEKWQEAWDKYDEVEITIAEFIRAAEQYESIVKDPANALALVDALEKGQQKIDELENDEVRQRFANAEHQLYMAELAKNNLRASRKAQFRKRKAAEQRIAELESRTVKLPKLKMLEDYLAEVAIEERKKILVGVKLEFHRALTDAGIKVEAE